MKVGSIHELLNKERTEESSIDYLFMHAYRKAHTHK